MIFQISQVINKRIMTGIPSQINTLDPLSKTFMNFREFMTPFEWKDTADGHPEERKILGGNYKLGHWVKTIITSNKSNKFLIRILVTGKGV